MDYNSDHLRRRFLFLSTVQTVCACAVPPNPPIPRRTFQTEFANHRVEVFDGEKKTCFLNLYDAYGDDPGYDCFRLLSGELTTSQGSCAFYQNLFDDGDELVVQWYRKIDSGPTSSFSEPVIVVKIKSSGKLYGDESEVRDVGDVKYILKGSDVIKGESDLRSCE